MIPAAHGHPRLDAVLAVLAGGTLAAGGGHALNCWFDRDIDAEMARTRRRPLPDGRIPAWHALAIGIALNVLAFAVLWTWTNLLAAVLALTGTLIYVLVYTMWLKRATPQNIVIGGAAGAIPPLVGWAAVTGRLGLTALALFAVRCFPLVAPPHLPGPLRPAQAQPRPRLRDQPPARRSDPGRHGRGRPRRHDERVKDRHPTRRRCATRPRPESRRCAHRDQYTPPF